jgi:phospholipase C
MTAIKHLIVVIGENHSFDNVFGGYAPPAGQSIMNLLSEGVITASGGQGPNWALAEQQQASVTSSYSITPSITGPYSTLPQPNTTYANQQPQWVPDARFPANLANGPFQITEYVPYTNAYVGDPVPRFFQQYQQMDGGKNDLFVWTAVTAGLGPESSPAPTPGNTYQGALSMGYYNMSAGDAPHFQFMAQNYAIGDNYHQPVIGSSDPNIFWLKHGDMKYYDDSKGNPTVPPASEIENPNPQPGSNNFYTQDGPLATDWANCSDLTQPGIAAIWSYLNSLSYALFNGGNCAPNSYYKVNNQPHDGLTEPSSQLPTLDDELTHYGISFTYYGSDWGNGIDSNQILTDIANNNLASISFVIPHPEDTGHPAYSSLSAFEGFATNLTNAVIANSSLYSNTAIIITMDKSGGYYDTGYVQPIDFFGDASRVVLIAISPYAKAGFVDHVYYDHSSLHKFIEENWGIPPISSRTRDNLPNPSPSSNPYVPGNPPAIGDLMNLFDFANFRANAPPIQ